MEDTGNGRVAIGKLEEAVQTLKDHVAACPIVESVKDHETRIRALERWRWQIIGAIALAQTVGAGAVIAAVKSLLK